MRDVALIVAAHLPRAETKGIHQEGVRLRDVCVHEDGDDALSGGGHVAPSVGKHERDQRCWDIA